MKLRYWHLAQTVLKVMALENIYHYGKETGFMRTVSVLYFIE